MRELLTDEQVDARLAAWPGWRRVGRELHGGYRFSAFLAAVQFTTQLAQIAEELNHHPEWTVRYRHVELLTTTHDAGGLTSLDLQLVERADALATSHGAEPG